MSKKGYDIILGPPQQFKRPRTDFSENDEEKNGSNSPLEQYHKKQKDHRPSGEDGKKDKDDPLEQDPKSPQNDDDDDEFVPPQYEFHVHPDDVDLFADYIAERKSSQRKKTYSPYQKALLKRIQKYLDAQVSHEQPERFGIVATNSSDHSMFEYHFSNIKVGYTDQFEKNEKIETIFPMPELNLTEFTESEEFILRLSSLARVTIVIGLKALAEKFHYLNFAVRSILRVYDVDVSPSDKKYYEDKWKRVIIDDLMARAIELGRDQNYVRVYRPDGTEIVKGTELKNVEDKDFIAADPKKKIKRQTPRFEFRGCTGKKHHRRNPALPDSP